jgi:hypothetical protein
MCGCEGIGIVRNVGSEAKASRFYFRFLNRFVPSVSVSARFFCDFLVCLSEAIVYYHIYFK